MRSKRLTRFLFCMCFVAGILVYFTSDFVYAENGRKVRVGYYLLDGFQEKDASGDMGGYDYEYLQELAKYTGWDYEYVVAPWEECYQMLKRGEIDLLGGVELKGSVSKDVLCASLPAGTNILTLLAKPSKGYLYEDFDAFDKMKVGLLKNGLQEQNLEAYCKQNEFTIQKKYYDSYDQMQNALKKEEVDAILVNIGGDIEDCSVIAQISTQPFYFATSQSNGSLWYELNRGMESIMSSNYDYNTKIYSKYNTTTNMTAFTKEEAEYIASSDAIPVSLCIDIPIISEYDQSTNTFFGIMKDILNIVSARTGLDFECTKYQESDKENENTIVVAPFFISDLTEDRAELVYSDSLLEGKSVMLVHKDRSFIQSDKMRLAVPKEYHWKKEELQKTYPNAEIILTDKDAGVKMVRDGQADATFVEETVMSYLLQSPYNEDLEVLSEYSFRDNMVIALSKNVDSRLLSILNKGINSIDNREINHLIVNNMTEHPYQMSLIEKIYKNRYLAIVIVLSVGFLLAMFCILLKNRMRINREKEAKHVVEAKRKADLEYQQKLFRQANFDALTGVYTRTYFIQKATEMWKANTDIYYAMIFINIDNFKLINNMFGWDVGNEVLRNIADGIAYKIRTRTLNKGVYGRIHADEFVVFVPASGIENKISNQDCSDRLCINNQTLNITYHVGIYVEEDKKKDIETMMECALMALKSVKGNYTNKVSFYNDNLLSSMLRQQEIADDMEEALEDRQFQMYLQPQYNIKENRVIGAEALVRWKHPTKGMISPGEFIPVFEHNGFISKLDVYIWEEACKTLRKWREQYHVDIPISVNVSRTDIFNANWKETLDRLVKKYDIPPALLHIEITETAYMENQQELIAAGEALRDMGFTIAMDDFGSGYSSLNMLKDVPVDILKLDMRFLYSDKNSANTGNILKAMVNMADWMSLSIIAEGVEYQEQSDFLGSIGCNVIQGYLYGKPMPVEEFEKEFILTSKEPTSIA